MQFINVMLLDDDYLVLKDLCSIVDWRKLGFKIVAMATNGKNGLMLFKKYKPQLVICDVCMPVMNGLDFIEIVRKINPDIQIIVISSYEKFHYVKRAIANGVYDYILKNEITKYTLTEKLSKVSVLFNNVRESKEQLLRMALNDYFISSKTDEDYISKNATNKSILNTLSSILEQKYLFFCFTLHLPLKKIHSHTKDIKVIGKRIFEHIYKLLPFKYPTPILFYINDMVIIGYDLSQLETYNNTLSKNLGREIINKLSNSNSNFIQPHSIIGFYYPRKINIREFKSLIWEKISVIKFLATFPYNRLINLYKYKNEQVITTPFKFDYSLINKCKNNPQDYYSKLENYMLRLYKNKDIDNIVSLFHNIILNYEILTNYRVTFNDVYYFYNYSECIEFLKNAYRKCIYELNKNSNLKYSTTVINAINYIKQNFQDSNLSIEQIAENVSLSSGRLCVVFKQETGKTINDYLTDLRIQYAIYFLVNTNLKVYEIAEQVGYKSSQYFSQIFREKTGRSPIDFRKNR